MLIISFGLDVTNRYRDTDFEPVDLTRGQSFVAYRTASCADEAYPQVLGMRTIGDKVYAVVNESPMCALVLKSYLSFTP